MPAGLEGVSGCAGVSAGKDIFSCCSCHCAAAVPRLVLHQRCCCCALLLVPLCRCRAPPGFCISAAAAVRCRCTHRWAASILGNRWPASQSAHAGVQEQARDGLRICCACSSLRRCVAATGLRPNSYSDLTEPLPALHSFTFLRLGPELLQPSHQTPWLRFMLRMQHEQELA